MSEALVNNSRFEVKYRIDQIQYLQIKHAIRPFVIADSYTRNHSAGKYFVRSLYYDSYDYRFYHEKMNGDHERLKLRLRTYTKDIEKCDAVRVELKVRHSNSMVKHSHWVGIKEYLKFIETRHWQDSSNKILSEFERVIHLLDLSPKVLIEYFRDGYAARSDSGLRITFDHKVSGSQSDELFPERKLFKRQFSPGIIVMEIKSNDVLPSWLQSVIRNYGLRWVANSKFSHGIQASRHDLMHPNGIVVVR